jgi:alpha-2-macroglobulin
MRVFLVFLLSLILNMGDAFALPKVAEIIPRGDIEEKPAQILIRYTEPVVALGKMTRDARELAVEITPEVNCDWRWIDRSTLACQISGLKPLETAVTYSVKVKKSADALDSMAFSEEFAQEFTLSRPEISYDYFDRYLSPLKPRFYVQSNVALTQGSVEKHLYFKSDSGQRYAAYVEQLPHNPSDTEEYRDENFVIGTWWSIVPDGDLPVDQSYTLKSEAGLSAQVGNAESSIEREHGKAATIGEFKSKGVRCYAVKGREKYQQVSYDQSALAATTDLTQLCNPLKPVYVVFTSPVTRKQLQAALSLNPNPFIAEADSVWENIPAYEDIGPAHRLDREYLIEIPGPLKSGQNYQLLLDGAKLEDYFGRKLSDSASYQFPVGDRKARIVQPPAHSVLESTEDTSPAIYLTNIENLRFEYQGLSLQDGYFQGKETLTPYQVKNLSYKFPLPVRSALKGESGLLTGILSSPEKKSKKEEKFFIQRTPFMVHAKVSVFNSLVWVTDSKTGEPVSGARVEFLKGTVWSLLKGAERLAQAVTNEQGIAILPGTGEIDPQHELIYEWEEKNPRLIIKVSDTKNIAALPLGYDFRVDTKFYGSLQKKDELLRAWGTTAQGIYRAGDTMQFKLFVRSAANQIAFRLVDKQRFTLEITDPLGKNVYQKKGISLNGFGAFSDTFAIAKSAAVGWYQFRLISESSKLSFEPLRVLVSDFTPAPFKVALDLDKKTYQPGDTIKIRTTAAFHAGGAYGGAKGRLAITAQPTSLDFDKPNLEGFAFIDSQVSDDKELLRKEFVLGKNGEEITETTLPAAELIYGNLRFDGVVADQRGKNIAAVSTIPYFGRDHYAGVRTNSWVFEKGKDASFDVVVVDTEGTPSGGRAFTVRIERDEVRAAQVKGAGNAFLPSFQTEKLLISETAYRSSAEPLTLKLNAKDVGLHRIIVISKDDAGREQRAQLERWVVGSGEMLWYGDAEEQMVVTPEKNSYAIGETARFLVQNPFPGALALISVERGGVITQRIEKLTDATSIVSVPVESRFAPGFYLSVVVASPRVAKPIEKGVDLGKPAFRAGYAQVAVPVSNAKLQVVITPERERYQPGEEVVLTLEVKGNEVPQGGVELGVTVLDQAVFDLIKDGESIYDIYSAFYQKDSLGVLNFNLLKKLIGRQNFERKGEVSAGDGGRGAELRSVDTFVAYWNPTVLLPKNGKASVRFKAPGNLTAWRVFALAVDRGAQMGNGTGSFAVSKPLEIRPVNPQIVRLGDSFQARFSVMNRAENADKVTLTVSAQGGAQGEKQLEGVVIEAAETSMLAIDLKANSLQPIELEVRAQGVSAKDAFKVSIPVLPSVSYESFSQSVSVSGLQSEVALKVPSDLKPGDATLKLALFPSLVGDPSAPFSYMKDYPYTCWEQRLSKALLAAAFLKGGNNLPASFTWQEASEVVASLFKLAADFQGESGGFAYFKAGPESIDPYLSAYTGLAFEWLSELGFNAPIGVTEKLNSYLSDLLKKDPTAQNLYDSRSLLQVRVLALRVLAAAKIAQRDDALRFSDSLSQLDVFFKSALLESYQMLAMKKEAQLLADMIKASGNETSGSIVFNDSLGADGFRVLSSAVRGSCMVLNTLLNAESKAFVSSDWLHKVVSGIVKQKKANDRWLNTQEQAICVTALRKFLKTEHGEKGALEMVATIEGDAFANARFLSPQAPAQIFERTILPTEFGLERKLFVKKSGNQTGYATVGLRYPEPMSERREKNAGIEIHREYSIKDGNGWKVVPNKLSLKLGDVVRSDLYVTVPAARTFVVLEDRLAATFESINKQLATTSGADGDDSATLIPAGSRFVGMKNLQGMGYGIWGFAHFEQRKDSVRYYAEYLEPGTYHLSHLLQVVAPGEFVGPAAHIEEMYTPDVFGRSAELSVVVKD